MLQWRGCGEQVTVVWSLPADVGSPLTDLSESDAGASSDVDSVGTGGDQSYSWLSGADEFTPTVKPQLSHLIPVPASQREVSLLHKVIRWF